MKKIELVKSKVLQVVLSLIFISTGCSNNKPRLTLNGDSTIVIMQGEQYADTGATATNENGNELTVNSYNNIDSNRPGRYGITYYTDNNNGEHITASRIIYVKGNNLLTDKNPNVFKDSIDLYKFNGYEYADASHCNNGSGSFVLKGQKEDVYSKMIETPSFRLEKGKRYTLSVYLKMVGVPKGQNIFMKVIPKNNDGSPSEVLWNIAEPNEWEEALLPYRATCTGEYTIGLLIHKYAFSTDGNTISKDFSNMDESPDIYIDDFSVVESEDVVSREDNTPKTPFESSVVRIDTLGNWSVKENEKWINIFPRFAYQDWREVTTDKDGDSSGNSFASETADYFEYGFTGFANIDHLNKLKTAVNGGLKYNFIQINGWNSKTENLILEVNSAIRNGELPANSLIGFQYDNEVSGMGGDYQGRKLSAVWLDNNDKDPVTGKRERPIFVLNGVAEGIARNLKNSNIDFMDVTGSYITQDGEATDIRFNPLNTLEYLNKTDKQKAPVSLCQMQAYYQKTFIPMLFKGIIQGGKGLKFWRGGTTHNGSEFDFKDNYWAPALKGKNGIFAKIDQLLPVIRQPLPENWSAVVPQSVSDTIAIGIRDYDKKHYLILANFSEHDKTVKIDIGGIYVTKAKDFFDKSGNSITEIVNGEFEVNIGHFNEGYMVLEIK
jgi:hypothetical protein